jgi:hypothetical protein
MDGFGLQVLKGQLKNDLHELDGAIGRGEGEVAPAFGSTAQKTSKPALRFR